MKKSSIKVVLLMAGVMMLLLVRTPGSVPAAYAIPPAALTFTPEPPTLTPTPAATNTPTVTSTPTGSPTATATVTPSSTATRTPKPTNEPDPQVADPAVTKAVNPGEARIGDEVDFTLTVTNNGNAPAEDVVVTDVLPDFLDVIGASADKGTVAVNGRTVVVTIGSVAPGEVISIQIRARVNENALPPGGRNSVTLSTSSGTDNPINNVDAVNITILQPPATPMPSATPIPSATSAPAVRPPSPSRKPPVASGVQPRPRLPRTSAADDLAGVVGPLMLIGLAALALSLLTHRRAAREAANIPGRE